MYERARASLVPLSSEWPRREGLLRVRWHRERNRVVESLFLSASNRKRDSRHGRAGRLGKIYIYIYMAYVCDDRDSRLAHHRENHRPSQFLLFRSLLNSPSAIRFERFSLVMDGARSNSREVNLIRAKFRLISGSRLQSGRTSSKRENRIGNTPFSFHVRETARWKTNGDGRRE